MADKKLIKQWQDEEKEALLSFDVEKMKKFYLKWQAKGVYKNPLQSEAFEGDIDDVICYLHDEADFSRGEILEVMNEPLFRGHSSGQDWEVGMIGYIKALENIADAIWYLNQVVDISDDDCQKVLQGLQEASDTLTDSRNELCGWCGAYKAADIGACDHCRWR